MDSSDPKGDRDLPWRVASRCQGGACVQVAPSGKMIAIGDSKNSGGPILTYTRAEWSAFVAGIRRGEFDDL